MKSILSLLDLDQTDFLNLLDRADRLHDEWHRDKVLQSLTGKRVGLWFYGTGFRNRLAFELGVQAMGGTTVDLPGEFGLGEPIEDIGHYLSNWLDLLIVRARIHEQLTRLAGSASIPVINAKTDRGHPCEILGDLQFVRRHRGTLEDLRVVFVGECTNLCRSWLEATTLAPISVTQVCPPGYEASATELAELQRMAIGELQITNDLDEALAQGPVDVLYTDCWPARHSDEDSVRVERDFLPYQIQIGHLDCLSVKGVFLPCPPVTRGEEASVDAVADKRNMNYQAKEYLLHAQNALLELAVLPVVGLEF